MGVPYKGLRAWAMIGTALAGCVFWQAPVSAQTKATNAAPVAVPVGSAPAPGTLGGVPILNAEALAALQGAVKGPQRIEPARDRWRNPAATLQFFGVRPGDRVVEIWPGQGWYSSILGPYLKQGGGTLIVGHFDTAASTSPVVRQFVETYQSRFAANPDTYGKVEIVAFGPRSGPLAPAGSVDSVLTFRNIHNWMAQGWAEKAFGDFFLALKPGGILGIEEHRGRTDEPQDPLARDGYVREDYVIQLAREAGFEFVGRSEINANAADTKDHPFGVWTLPPVARTSPAGQPDDPSFDRSRYGAIGESDRMTLRFRKPLSTAKARSSKPDAVVPPVVVTPAVPTPQPPPRRPWIGPLLNPLVKKPTPIEPPPAAPPTEIPSKEIPSKEAPEAASPEAKAPELTAPEIKAPEVKAPEAAPTPVPAPAPETPAPTPIGAPETDATLPQETTPPPPPAVTPEAKPAPKPASKPTPKAKPAEKPITPAKRPSPPPAAKPAPAKPAPAKSKPTPKAVPKSTPKPPPASPTKAKPAPQTKAKPAPQPKAKPKPTPKVKQPPEAKAPPAPAPKPEKPDWVLPRK